MFRSKITVSALLLLLFAHYTQAFVLLTANVEDVKKIARKFVSEPLAEQIAQFIVKASGQTAIPNVSAENEQNVSGIQSVSENELDPLSKIARQKQENKKESDRYIQQTHSTQKTPVTIEFVEDKSDTVTIYSESLIQYKKTKDPDVYDYIKRNPKHEDLKEASKENFELPVDKTTTRQQKRWKKKERLRKEERHSQAKTTQYRPRKRINKEVNFDDNELLFHLVSRNDNGTNNNKLTDFPSSNTLYNNKNNDKKNREMRINEKSTSRQYYSDSMQHNYTPKYYEKNKSTYRSEKDDRHAQKAFNEYMDNYPKDMPMYIPVDAPMDIAMDESNEDPEDINLQAAKDLETANDHNFEAVSPIVNAFNIAPEIAGHKRKSKSKRKSFIVATSGYVMLPAYSVAKHTQSRQRAASSPKP